VWAPWPIDDDRFALFALDPSGQGHNGYALASRHRACYGRRHNGTRAGRNTWSKSFGGHQSAAGR
jgi:hypothetical protein